VGHPNADAAIAVTSPVLRIDQTGLLYQQRRAGGRIEFRFQTGVLRLELRQTILIDASLSSCAQTRWSQHERDHVRDNRSLMGRMEPRIRTSARLRGILIQPRWHPRPSFNRIQNRIESSVTAIFVDLTAQAVRRRDTRAEYRRVQRGILQGCPGPYVHTVERGDTLSGLAKYFYGRSSLWPTIHAANRRTIGGDPDLIRVGQRLVIPKSGRRRTAR